MNVTDNAATEQGTHKQQLHNSIWFLSIGIMFSFKIVHMYQKMLETLI
jgi:hypothetical protein